MAKFHPHLVIEGELSLSGATLLLLEELERLEPFGEGNPVPRFCFPRVRPCFTRIAAEKHVQCQLEDDSGATLPAIAFSQAHTLLGETFLKKNYMSVVGSVKKNEWNQKPQIIIEDAKV
jgi:single-stranded-DNA-specific exonuclease